MSVLNEEVESITRAKSCLLCVWMEGYRCDQRRRLFHPHTRNEFSIPFISTSMLKRQMHFNVPIGRNKISCRALYSEGENNFFFDTSCEHCSEYRIVESSIAITIANKL